LSLGKGGTVLGEKASEKVGLIGAEGRGGGIQNELKAAGTRSLVRAKNPTKADGGLKERGKKNCVKKKRNPAGKNQSSIKSQHKSKTADRYGSRGNWEDLCAFGPPSEG